MPDAQSQLGTVGNVTKALLDALDQIEQQVVASQIGPDGKPSKTAIYMHMPMGYPIDPKMYANPWTPAGGDSSSSFGNDGTFAGATAATASSSPAPAPAGSVYAPPPAVQADPQMEASIQAAFFTSQLVDQMLEVTKDGIASSWPERDVSVEYFTVVQGIQPLADVKPAQAVLDRVAAAQALLYQKDAQGNFIGYTPLYAQFRHNQTAWINAISDQAAAYAQAMADPVHGAAWPVAGQKYANAVTQALNDFNSMGRPQVQAALDIIATQGESAVTAIAALAKQMYNAFQVQLAGSISSNVTWSYISPISWWDATDNSFGVRSLSGDSKLHGTRNLGGSVAISSNWQKQQSQSTSASASVNIGFASGGGSYSHANASNAFADHASQFNWSSHADTSSSASVTLEYFIATIERPWLLGDIFNIKGWYLVGQRANAISDGTIDNQVGEKCPAILPMIPKAFLIIRNVAITCDDWGDFATSYNNAAQSSGGQGQSSSNSVAVHAGYMFSSGSINHNDQQSSSAFGAQQTTGTISFTSDGGKGGTLKLSGSQIAGWIGQIQPAAPLIDDPTLPKPKDTQTTPQPAVPVAG